MTRERADEIERMVIYRNAESFASLNLSSKTMFEVGLLFGRLHQDLKTELDKEVIDKEQIKRGHDASEQNPCKGCQIRKIFEET